MRKSVCILSLSTVKNDARVLRQIRNLAPYYDITAVGYGEAHPEWKALGNVTWRPVQFVRHTGMAMLKSRAMLLLGRFFPQCYDTWFWYRRHHLQALEYATSRPFDVFHANDLPALPIAVKAAEKTGGKVIFDAHEYSPLECEYDWLWRQTYMPFVNYALRQCAPKLAASTTVSQQIADRYARDFGFQPIVVTNAPERIDVPEHEIGQANVRLIHHGTAMRSRKLELMIDTLARCDARYSLSMMLLESNDPGYIPWLKQYAQERAPGRVHFLPTVPVSEIVPKVSEFDIGIFLLEPNNFSFEMAMPNKLFDFIMAGLAVVIGPSPAMAEVVKRYRCGCVAPSFQPHEVAAILNGLSREQIVALRQASRHASSELNAGIEMPKLLNLYERLALPVEASGLSKR